MNKRQVIAELLNIANDMDNINMFNEANTLTKIAQRLVQSRNYTDSQHDRDRVEDKAIRIMERMVEHIGFLPEGMYTLPATAR